VSDEDIPFEPMYGPPAPSRFARSRGFRRLPRAALAGGLALGLAVGGAGIAYAAGSSGSTTTPPTTTPSGTKPAPPHGGGMGFAGFGGFRGFGGLGGFGPLGSVVHGQFTVRAPGGGYQTVDVQEGTVTAVSSTSITVASTNSFTQTYVVTAATLVDSQRDGIGSVSTKDQVEVVAKQSGSTTTAISIVDRSKVQNSRSGFGFPFGGPRGGPPPAKSGSASAAGSVD
jgi:hypothetical protein